ncbi:MAG: ABC transporter substrate-binding protein [Nitrospinota bacterium]
MPKKPFRFVNEDTVFTLPWDVGILEGLFEKAGLEVEVAEKNPSNTAPELFGRNKEALFEGQKLDAFNVCEWGAIKRTAVEDHRPSRILNLRESITAMGVVAGKDTGITHPDDLAGVAVGVQLHTGSHYMALKVLEGFLPKEDIQVAQVGGPAMRLRAVLEGKVKAAALMEPFLSFLEMEGNLIAMAYYNGLVVAGEGHDRETMEKIRAVLRQAVDLINQDKRKYAHLLLNDLPEDLRPRMTLDDLHVERLRYVYPRPYPIERYGRQARWMMEWGLLEEGAKPEKVSTSSC